MRIDVGRGATSSDLLNVECWCCPLSFSGKGRPLETVPWMIIIGFTRLSYPEFSALLRSCFFLSVEPNIYILIEDVQMEIYIMIPHMPLFHPFPFVSDVPGKKGLVEISGLLGALACVFWLWVGDFRRILCNVLHHRPPLLSIKLGCPFQRHHQIFGGY